MVLEKDDEYLVDIWGVVYCKGDQLMIYQVDIYKLVFVVLVCSRSF